MINSPKSDLALATLAPPIPFPASPASAAAQPCSFQECLSGHQWPIILAAATCPGCKGAVLAIQRTNCPICNEPCVRTLLRSDYVPRGAGISARCSGSEPMGESIDIELMRSAWREVESRHENFTAREARETQT